MSYLFSDIQGKLSSLLKDSNTGTDDQFPLASRKKELNRGEMKFCADSKLIHEYASGSVSGASITIPSDLLEIYVLIVNNYVITRDREISVKDWERWNQYSGNVPVYYFSEQSGVRYIKFFGSVNGLTYKLFYIKKPTTDLSSDSDVSILPDEFREALAYYAAAELLMQTGEHDQSDKMRAMYGKYVRDGQERASEIYLDKAYAVPDVNAIDGGTSDFQGQGFDYAR